VNESESVNGFENCVGVFLLHFKFSFEKVQNFKICRFKNILRFVILRNSEMYFVF
jgi:hypothetical protein